MAKFAIATKPRTTRTVHTTDPLEAEINKLGAAATSLTRAFCQRIMDVAKNSQTNDTDPLTEEVNKLFKTFPNDSTTARLAQVVELLTGGVKPQIGGPFLKVGEVVMNSVSKTKWVIVSVTPDNAHGIDVTADNYITFGGANNIRNFPVGTPVSLSETALFAKDFLKVKGSKLLPYITSVIGNIKATEFVNDLGLEAVL